MTDGVGITKPGEALAAHRPRGYQAESVREVQARAESIQQNTTPEELNGLKRLNKILGQDRPLKDNVPRGYYLNIRI